MSDTTVSLRTPKPASGRFVLRIDPALHARLREEARTGGISLNELCARKLALPGSAPSGPFGAALTRAATVVGDALVGVVGFGSWARREMWNRSDVDLLLIVEDGQEIHRGLYGSWDQAPVFWNGHPVEPLFVHLPPPGSRMSGLWAEVAVDGVVLFERDLRVSSRLVEFRREIASGRVSRRLSHGQPYWVGRA